MQVLTYPHPTLLRPSRPLRRVDAELRRLIDQMFELMYEHRGIGLAANQVNLPYRLFVVNPTGDRQSDDEQFVFINPVLSHPKGMAEDEEGCLSLPGLYAPVKRPERIRVSAYNLQGEEVTMDVDGLLARVVQHEYDHIDGILFIDRLSPTASMAVREQVEHFRRQFEYQRERGEIPDDAAILAELSGLEALRT